MAGKGDKPRNCCSKEFKKNYDEIKWKENMKIFNYIKNELCIPIAANDRNEADSLFLAEYKVEVDEAIVKQDKEQYKFPFYEHDNDGND
jgi:hypothetical protein|tara:strand:+ start:593 stop:859 length:267 start_codon:yes stop_codon:yes gene_type:complete